MSVLGVALVIFAFWSGHSSRPGRAAVADAEAPRPETAGIGWRRTLFVALLLFSLVIPSDWTQDVPARYGKRHAGLAYSVMYPRIEASEISAQPQGLPILPASQ